MLSIYNPFKNYDNISLEKFLSKNMISLNAGLEIEKFDNFRPVKMKEQVTISLLHSKQSPINAKKQIKGITLYEACLLVSQYLDVLQNGWIVPLKTTYEHNALPIIYLWDGKIRISVICEDIAGESFIYPSVVPSTWYFDGGE